MWSHRRWVLIEYSPSLFTVEKVMEAGEFKEENSDALNHIMNNEMLAVLRCFKIR